MASNVIETFTNRKGTIYRLVKSNALMSVMSGLEYYIDKFDGKDFTKITNGHFKDLQSAKKNFYLRQNIDGIIKRRDNEYSKEDYDFYKSLSGTKYENIYKLLGKFEIIDIEFEWDMAIYIVNMDNLNSITELKHFNINPYNIKRVRIQQEDITSYFGLEFRDGSGIGLLHTMDLPNSEKHNTLFNFMLNFSASLCW